MYVKFKQCPRNTEEHHTLKNNIHVFNSILKRTIREAKLKHYDNLFNQFRGDMKMTWKIISEIICKSINKRKELDKITVDSKTITDKGDMCKRFNEFFTNIGPKLAEKIDTENKKSFDSYLKERVLSSFTFSLVDHNTTLKCISSLASKKSSGHDGISLKLLKFLSPALIKPLTLIINQLLVTGIFPTKLKTAKILPTFKKDDVTLLYMIPITNTLGSLPVNHGLLHEYSSYEMTKLRPEQNDHNSDAELIECYQPWIDLTNKTSTLISMWISNLMPSRVGDKNTYPYKTFQHLHRLGNGGVSTLMRLFIMNVIIYPCWDQSMLVKGASDHNVSDIRRQDYVIMFCKMVSILSRAFMY